MSRVKLSTLHGFQSASLSVEKVAALQFFRHPPVRSVSLGIFSHLLREFTPLLHPPYEPLGFWKDEDKLTVLVELW